MTRFLEDGRICLSSNAAECALRGIAVGHRNWTFFGSDAGVVRATAVYPLARIYGHPAKAIADLLPWKWKPKT